MKNLTDYIFEKLKITKKPIKDKVIIVKDSKELKKIIHERYDTNKYHIDLTDIDVSNIETMNDLFSYLDEVKTIDITGWNTSNVTNFDEMFMCCYDLENIIGIEDLDTSNAKDISQMFRLCKNIKSLDLSGWNTSNVESLYAIFCYCTKLEEVNVTGWDTSKVASFASVFFKCSSLENIIGIENWDTSSAITIGSCFNKCSVLREIDLSKWDTSNVDSFVSLFCECETLKTIHGIENWKTSKVRTIANMFLNCWNLKSLDLSGWDIQGLRYLNSSFSGCDQLKEIKGIEQWDTKNILDVEFAFFNCKKLKTDLSNWDLDKAKNKNRAFTYAKNIIKPNLK